MNNIKKTTQWIVVLLVIKLIIELIHYFGEKQKQHSWTRMKTFRWRFGKIRYTVQGQGRAMLLLHRFDAEANSTDWQSDINILKNHYRVYAIDLLGYGKSDTPALSYSAYLYAALVRDFITQIIKSKTVIIAEGNSAAIAKMAYALNPSEVYKIILINPQSQKPNENKFIRYIKEWPIGKNLIRYYINKDSYGYSSKDEIIENVHIIKKKGNWINTCVDILREE